MWQDRRTGNRWIDLHLWPGRPLSGSGPLWAALCGLVASGGLRIDAQAAIAAGFALFLAGPLWGAVWQAVATVDWFTPFSAREWAIPAPWITLLPYTEPDSPAGRLAQGLGRARVWWRERLWPQHHSQLLGLLVAWPLSLSVALVLGRPAIALTVTTWALATLALLVDRGVDRPSIPLAAIVEGVLPWLLGHAALGLPTWPSVAAAITSGVTQGAALALLTGRRAALAWLNGGQIAVTVLLFVRGEPAAAVLVTLLLLCQLYLQSFLQRDGEPAVYLRRAQPFVMAGMLVTALAI
ncbi:MAG: hypothetical protein ACOYZ7_12905 [Chloroflexota bacterium]